MHDGEGMSKKVVKKFDVNRTALTMSIVCGITSTIVVQVITLILFLIDSAPNIGLMIGLSVFYFVSGYIFTALMCLIYNFAVSNGLPGISFELEDK